MLLSWVDERIGMKIVCHLNLITHTVIWHVPGIRETVVTIWSGPTPVFTVSVDGHWSPSPVNVKVAHDVLPQELYWPSHWEPLQAVKIILITRANTTSNEITLSLRLDNVSTPLLLSAHAIRSCCYCLVWTVSSVSCEQIRKTLSMQGKGEDMYSAVYKCA